MHVCMCMYIYIYVFSLSKPPSILLSCASSDLLELLLACEDLWPAIIEDSQEGEAKLLVLRGI